MTCRYFGMSRQTLYRWKKRYNPRDLSSLEERSHKPKHLRRPTWSPQLAQAVLELREQYPRWGKDKLVVLLHQKGWQQVSTSMVGRILTRLKVRGMLKEPLRSGVSTRKRLWQRPYAVRKPRGYEVKDPGDLVQVDTLDVRPLPGVVLKHFTARDVVSRWDVVEVHTRPQQPWQPASWTLSSSGCPSRYDLFRLTEAPSSRQPLNRLARNGAFDSLSCLPGPRSLMDASSGPSVPIQRSSMKSPTSPWRWPP